MVQSTTFINIAVFCGICDNYGIYGGIVGLQCISNLFLVIVIVVFQQNLDVLDGI